MGRCKFAGEVTGYIYVARCSCEKNKKKFDHLVTLKYCLPCDCKFYEKGEGVRNDPIEKEERAGASTNSDRITTGKKKRNAVRQ